MPNTMTIELYTRDESPVYLSQKLSKAGLHVRSIGVEHVYIEIDADSADAAMEAVRQALPKFDVDLHPVVSYLDNAVRPVAA